MNTKHNTQEEEKCSKVFIPRPEYEPIEQWKSAPSVEQEKIGVGGAAKSNTTADSSDKMSVPLADYNGDVHHLKTENGDRKKNKIVGVAEEEDPHMLDDIDTSPVDAEEDDDYDDDDYDDGDGGVHDGSQLIPENTSITKTLKKTNFLQPAPVHQKSTPKLTLTTNKTANSNLNVYEIVKSSPTVQTTITTSASPMATVAPTMIHAKISENKLLLVTMVNENGKLCVPLAKSSTAATQPSVAKTSQMTATAPITAATVPTFTTLQIPKLKIKCADIGSTEKIKISKISPQQQEIKSSGMEAITISGSAETTINSLSPATSNFTATLVDDDQQHEMPLRSSTPLAREFLALQKSFSQSKILSKYVNDTEKTRKSRKVPLKGENDFTSAGLVGGGQARRKSSSRYAQTQLNLQSLASDEGNIASRVVRRSRSKSSSRTISNLESNQSMHFETPQARVIRFKSFKDELNYSRCRSRSKSTVKDEDRAYSPSIACSSSSSKKRANMRSENLDFVQKQQKFMNRIMNDGTADEEVSEPTHSDSEEQSLNDSKSFIGSKTSSVSYQQQHQQSNQYVAENTPMAENTSSTSIATQVVEDYFESIWRPPPKRGSDSFCWKCCKCGELIPCSKCVRSFHVTCIKITTTTKLDNTWLCPECIGVDNFVNGQKKSKMKSTLSVDMLNQLLLFALKRMKEVKGYEKFLHLPGIVEFSSYAKYLVNPVTLTTLQEKIERKSYHCLEEFVNETKWIQHNNSIINCTNGNHKDAIIAKTIIKVCRQEAAEIETCPECYLSANTRRNWFVDICSKPHLLVWAKLKGFPYWPAKAMGPGQGTLVNVRFFGDHDRAFVHVKDCFLYSELDPNPQNTKRTSRTSVLTECIKEVKVHIDQIKAKIGAFQYAGHKQNYDPADEMNQLETMMPGVTEYMKRQQAFQKPPLQYKIVKTAGNQMSIFKKAESGTDSDQSSSVVIGCASGGSGVAALICNADYSRKKKHLEKATTTIAISQATQATNIQDVVVSNNCNSSKGKSSSSSCSANYEVISKSNKDEPNSSKINSVILKRKPESASSIDCGGGSVADGLGVTEIKKPKNSSTESNTLTLVTLPSKQPKIEKLMVERQESIVKRKYSMTQTEASEIEQKIVQSKSKQTKYEHKLPVPSAVADLSKTTDTPNTNKNILESLAKTKHSLTIKKINMTSTAAAAEIGNHQQVSTKKSSESISANARPSTKSAATSSSRSSCPNTSKSAVESLSSTESSAEKSPTAIIKGLIPFEDIKTEEPEESDDSQSLTEADTNREKADPVSNEQTNVAKVFPTPLLLPEHSVIKQESLCDENDDEAVHQQDKGMSSKSKQLATKSASRFAAITDSSSVRSVVTDETVHRISVRNIDLLKEQQHESTVTVAAAASITATTTTSTTTSGKKQSFRGVPYGPLPASATRICNNMQQNNNNHNSNIVDSTATRQRQQPNQRARKSFQNKSPVVVPASAASSPSNGFSTSVATPTSTSQVQITTTPTPTPTLNATPTPTPTTIVGTDPKRSLLKNSMVSIPVDSPGEYLSRKNSVPIPPLTAVLKTTSTAPNACGNPLNPATEAQSANAGITITSTNTATSNAAIRPLPHTPSMTAPPPLAGLSHSSPSPLPNIITCSATTATQNKTQNQAASASPSSCPSTSTASSIANGGSSGGVNISANFNGGTTTNDHLLGGFVTPNLASAITDAICRAPPKMVPGPTGALRSDGSSFRLFSQAGPSSQRLTENAHKMTDFFISVMQDAMADVAAADDALQAKVTLLTIELEQAKHMYEREIAELKHNTDMILCNMKKSMELETTRSIAEVRKQCELERLHSVEETKKQEWCANCLREARFYCCWNTPYCSYPCQQRHWSVHQPNCVQDKVRINSLNESSGGGVTRMMQSAPTVVAAATTSTTNSLSSLKTSVIVNQDIGGGSPRLAGSKASATTTTTPHNPSLHHFNINVSKKDKSHSNKPQSAAGSSVVSTSTEVMKLPSSTYVRTVHSSGRGGNPIIGSVPRFNVPVSQLPIKVNREGIWEWISTSISSTQMTSSVATASAPLVGLPPPMSIPSSSAYQTRIVSNHPLHGNGSVPATEAIRGNFSLPSAVSSTPAAVLQLQQHQNASQSAGHRAVKRSNQM